MTAEEEREGGRRWPRWRTIAIGVVLLLLLILALVWIERRPLATGFINRELERRGVQAHYEIAKIGFHTERLENVVIGDPKHPDLTAKSVEIHVEPRLGLPEITLIKARGVRLFGRIVNGKLSLGQIDKLLPPPSGAPFRLPDIKVDVADTALVLDTTAGRIAIGVEGKGNLSDGFKGEAAVQAHSLLLGGCAIDHPTAFVNVSVSDRRPSIEGPIRAERVVCGDSIVIKPVANLDVTLSAPLDGWIGRADLRADSARLGGNRFAGIDGRLSFTGNPKLTRGSLELAAARSRVGGFRTARLSLDGGYAWSMANNRLSLKGDMLARSVVAGPEAMKPIVVALSSANGTPVGPLGEALAKAVQRAGRDFDARASISLVNGPHSGAVRVERLSVTSRSGAGLGLTGGQGITYYWPAGFIRVDGEFALSGGGFPDARFSLSQAHGGAPITGVARIAPFSAGGARLQLGDIRFTAAPDGTTRIDTIAMIDGPLGDGRVNGLTIPIRGRLSGTGGFAFGEGCVPLSFRSLEVAGLRLGPTRLPLCPTGPALIWKKAGGAVQGGAVIRDVRLVGRLGGSPIAIAADRLRVDLGGPGFTAAGVGVRLGGADGAVTRLDLATLTGRFTGQGLTGTFTGGSGKIANVPLLMSEANGNWTLAGGDLRIHGGLTVADEANPPRFYPLVTNDFSLLFHDGRITAGGTLRDPETGTKVTDVSIEHVFETGRGKAVLDVPGITFVPDGFQPDALTRLTVGVVALVDGTLRGKGEIAWGPAGTTSTGTFSTEKMDLAAPFGPVTGLTTTIHFSDMLGLKTPPGQVATVDRIQAGIDVYNGRVVYQLLPDLHVRIQSAHWPFAGGDLTLEETVLDFSQPSTKKLTFHVTGLDAATFVQQMEFSNISATGTFDGVVPMEFDERGGRIVGGRLEARPDGGTLSYIGEVSNADLGTYGKLAFDALKSLRYSKLAIYLDGELSGEFVARIDLNGIALNSPRPGGIVGSVINQLAKIPFHFNISVRGPFRALIATMRSFEDPTALIQQALPPELRDQPTTVTVQPKESETMP